MFFVFFNISYVFDGKPPEMKSDEVCYGVLFDVLVVIVHVCMTVSMCIYYNKSSDLEKGWQLKDIKI